MDSEPKLGFGEGTALNVAPSAAVYADAPGIAIPPRSAAPTPTVAREPVVKGARGRIIAVGGGKGGVGKSLVTSSLGISLARHGKKVVVVDADLGGANLHTCLGLSNPSRTLSDFINRRVHSIEDVILETGVKNLGLISGAHDHLTASNLKYFQKTRLLSKIGHSRR